MGSDPVCALVVFHESRETLKPVAVALLAEGVDRNTDPEDTCECWEVSPSSRRAWIEM